MEMDPWNPNTCKTWIGETEMGPIFGPSYISGASLGDNSASWASYPRTRIYDADNILLYTKYAYLGC